MNAKLDKVLTFDRADVRGTQILLGALFVGATVPTVVVPIVEWIAGDPVVTRISTDVPSGATPPYDARAGAELAWSGDTVVTLTDPTLGQRLAGLLPGLVLAISAGVIIWLLLRLLRTISSGAPFSPQTVGALRGIALTLLATMAAVPISLAVHEGTLGAAALADVGDAVFYLPLGPSAVLGACGLMTAALAEAFKRGMALENDVEGLV